MKPYFLIIPGIFLFFVSITGAQTTDTFIGFTPSQRASFWTNKMNEKLSLTASQQKQVFNIFLTTATKVDSLRNNCDSISRKLKNINEILNERTLNFKKVLTPLQYSLFMAIKEEQMRKLNQSLRTNSK